MSIDRDDFEKRLEIARSRGASPEQIQAKRQQYAGRLVTKEPALKRVARAITKPAVNVARDVAGSAIGLGAGVGEIAQRLTVDPENKSKFFEKGLALSQRVMTPEFAQAATSRSAAPILGVGAQRGAQAASYLVPGGKTLKGAAGLGAAGGALSAAGDKAENFEDFVANVGAGALGGAIGGGATYGAGKALQAAGARLRPTTPKTQVSPKSVKGDDLFVGKNLDELQELSESLNLNRGQTPRQQVDTVRGAFQNTQNDINSLLVSADDIKQDTIINTFSKRLDASEFDDATPSQQRFLNNLLDRVGKTQGNPIEVNKLKSQLRGELGNAFKARDFGKLPSVKDQAKESLYFALKDSLDTVSPEVRQLNNYQARLFDLARDVASRFKGDEALSATIPFTNVAASTPVTKGQVSAGAFRAGTAATESIGSGIERTGSALQGRIPQVLGRELGAVSGTGRAQAPSTVSLPRLPEDRSTQEVDTQVYSPLEVNRLRSQGIDPSTKFVISPDGREMWNPNTQSFVPYSKEVYGGTKAGSGQLSKDQANARSGIRATEDVRNLILGGGEVNRSVLARSLLPFGGGSGDAQILDNARREMQDVIQRLRTGAAISENEAAFYEQQLPKLTDTRETLEYKLNQFDNLFRSIGGQ